MTESDALPYQRKEIVEAAEVYQADCRELLKSLPTASIDSIVTDPPYELGFMGKGWDRSGIANDVSVWQECLRVLKPGGHLLAFSGSRTYHRMASAIEDAGFDIRDQIMWIYGSGFPKSLDVSKALDKAAGAEREIIGKRSDRAATPKRDMRGGNYIGATGSIDLSAITAPATESAKQWEGWGTALKPAHEPVCFARKPFRGSVTENVISNGTGAINVRACRVEGAVTSNPLVRNAPGFNSDGLIQGEIANGTTVSLGRWPANVIHDGSHEVITSFPDAPGQIAKVGPEHGAKPSINTFGDYGPRSDFFPRSDGGSAARFFYCAKASKEDRDEGLDGFSRSQYSHDGGKRL